MDLLSAMFQIAIGLSVVSLIVGVISLRSRGGSQEIHSLMDAAFLGGGPGRVAETALVAMHADGRLGIGGPGIVAVYSDVARDPVEHAVLQEHARAPHGALHSLRLAVMRSRAVQDVGDSLAARGLLIPAANARLWVYWGLTQALLCLLLIPVTIVMLVSSGSPAAIPTLPLAFIGVFSGIFCAALAKRRLTAAGIKARAGFRTAYTHITAPAHLVALDGPSALPDTLLREQLTVATLMRPGRDFQPDAHLAAATVEWCASAGFADGSSGGSGGCGASGGGGCGSSGGSGCGGGSGSGSGGCGGGGGGGCGGGGGGG
ncbi:TIGR04222 domain-containing membrane protein [Streptomyces sp. NPDC058665]|uniref:TIGR04222 domain-containing membrane protein n=1 Tax=Streptomyces sp. NPDC058665 TaxID=3346586 RepID=UPI0036633FF0